MLVEDAGTCRPVAVLGLFSDPEQGNEDGAGKDLSVRAFTFDWRMVELWSNDGEIVVKYVK